MQAADIEEQQRSSATESAPHVDVVIAGAGPHRPSAGDRARPPPRRVSRRRPRAPLVAAVAGLAVQARTLEVFEDLGIAAEAVDADQRLGAFNIHPTVAASPVFPLTGSTSALRAEEACYLVRPDGYVGLRSSPGRSWSGRGPSCLDTAAGREASRGGVACPPR